MRLLSRADLKSRGITFEDTQLRELVKIGKFPKPVKMGLRRNAWLESDIDAWIARLIAERDGVAA
ncbi:AlpA family phage regulatory protein [Rhizobium leguminosarum]|nr:AlpA family phage regulatory protein [Rhizobium leguminosarum]